MVFRKTENRWKPMQNFHVFLSENKYKVLEQNTFWLSENPEKSGKILGRSIS